MGNGKMLLSYAEGYDPATNPHWHEDATQAMGGDDSSQALECEIFEDIFRQAPTATKLVIDVYPDRFGFAIIGPQPKPPAAAEPQVA